MPRRVLFHSVTVLFLVVLGAGAALVIARRSAPDRASFTVLVGTRSIGVVERTLRVQAGGQSSFLWRSELAWVYRGDQLRIEREFEEAVDSSGRVSSLVIDPTTHPKHVAVAPDGVLRDQSGRELSHPSELSLLAASAFESRVAAIANEGASGGSFRVFGLDVDLPRAEVVRVSPGHVISDCPIEVAGLRSAHVERDVGSEDWIVDLRGSLVARRAIRGFFGSVWLVRADRWSDQRGGEPVDVTSRVIPTLEDHTPRSGQDCVLRVADRFQALRAIPSTSSQRAQVADDGVWRVETASPQSDASPWGVTSLAGTVAERLQTLVSDVRQDRSSGAATERAIERAIRTRFHFQSGSWFADAHAALSAGKSNCVGLACVAASVARQLGYEARVVSGFVHVADAPLQGRLEPHRWIEIRVGEEWRLVDPAEGGESDWRIGFAVWDYREESAWADGIRAASAQDFSGTTISRLR
ncbi:MAG: hypothetical protein K8T90_08405 [Planctomycetes bacterium]|nr:hypothetical protein [Planctomycetota bacterium]